MSLTLKQPFIDGINNVPDRKKDINKIRNWMNSQSHLPQISDDFIYLFLHACYYSIDRTKDCIESYFTLRTNGPLVFANRDLHSEPIQLMMSLAEMAMVPKLTPEGHRILIYRLKDTDYRKMLFPEAVKAFCMVNDCILSEDGIIDGYVVIFDMKGVQLGHLARVSLPALKIFMNYIQDAHPARLKGIHVLNTASFIQHVMRLVLPMIKSPMMELVKFHQGSYPEGIPVEHLPSDFGGPHPDVSTIHNQLYDRMMAKYVTWLKETELLKVDETKRPKKSSWLNIFSSSGPKEEVSFRTVAEID